MSFKWPNSSNGGGTKFQQYMTNLVKHRHKKTRSSRPQLGNREPPDHHTGKIVSPNTISSRRKAAQNKLIGDEPSEFDTSFLLKAYSDD